MKWKYSKQKVNWVKGRLNKKKRIKKVKEIIMQRYYSSQMSERQAWDGVKDIIYGVRLHKHKAFLKGVMDNF